MFVLVLAVVVVVVVGTAQMNISVGWLFRFDELLTLVLHRR